MLFFGQWFVRQFVVQVITNRPNPVLNPLDQIGVMYFGIAIALQIAYLLRSGIEDRQSKDSENPVSSELAVSVERSTVRQAEY